MNLEKTIISMAQKAKAAALELAVVSSKEKDSALKIMAKALRAQRDFLIKENQKDLIAAQKEGLTKALIDRLVVNDKVVEEMAKSLEDTAKLTDPVGEILKTFSRPNGLQIQKVRVPIGVVGIIYESRPNVTSDCIALCLKSGNAAILKGGKEAIHSNRAIFQVLQKALIKTKIPANAVQLVDSVDRSAVTILLQQDKYVDCIIPRGGESLIEFVAKNSTIPVVKHYKGVCHTYVSDKADLKMAKDVCFNAKVQKPATCNAMETLLVHEKVAKKFLTEFSEQLRAANVEIRGDAETRAILTTDVKAATMEDWSAEYLDLILSVKVVKNLDEAIDHINTFGSHHSDSIITKNKKEADAFLARVDSACVYVNASTRFTDGFQFGFGAEIGISTDKLHARGPMGLEEMTSYKYLVRGNGQVRK